jgi:type IV secretory pathway TrbD component
MTHDDLTPEERKAFEQLPKEKAPSDILEERTVQALQQEGLLRPQRQRTIEITSGRLASLVAACFALVVVGFGLGRWTVAVTGPRISPETQTLSASDTDAPARSPHVEEQFAEKKVHELSDRATGDVEDANAGFEGANTDTESEADVDAYDRVMVADDVRAGRSADVVTELPPAGRRLDRAREERAVSTVGESVEQSLAADVQQKGSAYLVALSNLAQLPDSARVHDPGREVALNSLYAAADETVRLFPENGIASRILDALEPAQTHAETPTQVDEPQERAKTKSQKQIIWF